MSEKTRMLFGIIAICILGLGAYMYLSENKINTVVSEPSINQNIDNEDTVNGAGENQITKEKEDFDIIDVDFEDIVSQKEGSDGFVVVKRTKIISTEADIYKREYEEVSYKDFFKNTMIKYPEILEYPDLLDSYVLFETETREVRDIDMKKYESLWIDLYKNDLFQSIERNIFGENKWFVTGLSKMFELDSQREYSSNNCAVFDGLFGGCFAIIENNEKLNFIYQLKGEIKEVEYKNQKYVLNRASFGDSCAFGEEYKLYNLKGVFLNKIHHGMSSCDSTINSFTKGDLRIEFVYYSKIGTSYKDGSFQEIAVYYKGKLVEKKVYEISKFNFDLNKNLFNGDNIEINIGDNNLIFNEDDYVNKEELEDMYGMYGVLEKTEKGYSLMGKLGDGFEYNSDATGVSVLNCKDNNSETSDDWYTLNKFTAGEINYSYNIAMEYGNYCKDGIYTVKIDIVNKRSGKNTQWVSDYKLNLQ